MNKVIVTIDGPAGAGKSTVARRLADALGYLFLDTGALYRSVAWLAKAAEHSWDDGPLMQKVASTLDLEFVAGIDQVRVFLGGRDATADIRAPDIGTGASKVSAHPGVRAALLPLQRRIAGTGGVVAEGRDCGTVVFPLAQAKFFLTASVQERARRRAAELAAAGHPADLAVVTSEIADRDWRDQTRSVAPLVKAADAVEIDSGGLTPDQVLVLMTSLVRSREAAGV